MRADRLLTILLLLQNRQQMSAQELADELCVSVRTIYRDIEALCLAGIPVYAEMGALGGYRLMENYRAGLTGLTKDEFHSLLMLNIPEPLAALDAGQKLKAALLKLYASQWNYSGSEREVQQRIYLDWVWWGQNQTDAPHLQMLYEAVWNDRKVIVGYKVMGGLVDIDRTVDAYGLVAKAGVWYLVYAGDGRVHFHRVAEFTSVEVCDETFERPADFDLEAYWKSRCSEIEEETLRFSVTLRTTPAVLSIIQQHFRRYTRGAIRQVSPLEEAGWLEAELLFESFESARSYLLGRGGSVEIVQPEALRFSVLDFAAQVLKRYESK